jgi:hypothetical protein
LASGEEMKVIATHVDDSVQKMQQMLSLEKEKPNYAINPYFYRSHVVYQKELSSLVFRSWIYAGHTSEVKKPGDYLLFVDPDYKRAKTAEKLSY